MKININVMTGNWFDDGTPEVGKVIEEDVNTVKEFDRVLDRLDETAKYFITDEEGKKYTDYEIVCILRQKKTMIKDGWHTVAGCSVYVEDGYIKRATKSGDTLPAGVYRWSKFNNAWMKEDKITPAAFRAGVKRGTIAVMNTRPM